MPRAATICRQRLMPAVYDRYVICRYAAAATPRYAAGFVSLPPALFDAADFFASAVAADTLRHAGLC